MRDVAAAGEVSLLCEPFTKVAASYRPETLLVLLVPVREVSPEVNELDVHGGELLPRRDERLV